MREHTAPLCVMSNFGGRSRYQVGSNNFCLDDTRYLVLNQGQRFSASIESNVPVESLNLWFRPDFAEEALALAREIGAEERFGWVDTSLTKLYERRQEHDRSAEMEGENVDEE